MSDNNVYNDDNNKEIMLGLPNNEKYLEIKRVWLCCNGIMIEKWHTVVKKIKENKIKSEI